MSLCQIEQFLQLFREIATNKGLTIIPTEKNRRELSQAGILPHERREIIFELNRANYCEGPVPDHDTGTGDVWIFGYKTDHETWYIKLKLDNEAKCLSFHRAEFPMTYPYGK